MILRPAISDSLPFSLYFKIHALLHFNYTIDESANMNKLLILFSYPGAEPTVSARSRVRETSPFLILVQQIQNMLATYIRLFPVHGKRCTFRCRSGRGLRLRRRRGGTALSAYVPRRGRPGINGGGCRFHSRRSVRCGMPGLLRGRGRSLFCRWGVSRN